MIGNISKIAAVLLIGLHFVLALWSLVGLAEWFVPDVPWKRLSNPLFPAEILLAHWLSILTASTIFIFGYFLKWRWTPAAMTFGYAAMAGVCAVETFGYLQHKTKFVDMAAEYIAYALILLFLYNSDFMKQRFSRVL